MQKVTSVVSSVFERSTLMEHSIAPPLSTLFRGIYNRTVLAPRHTKSKQYHKSKCNSFQVPHYRGKQVCVGSRDSVGDSSGAAAPDSASGCLRGDQTQAQEASI